jgi:hypothetical protein
MDLMIFQYEMLVDVHVRHHQLMPKYKLWTFYSQLWHIFVIHFDRECDLGLDGKDTIIMAAVQNCILDDKNPVSFENFDIHRYSWQGPLHFFDVMGLQCFIAQVQDGDQWSILD